MPPPRRVVTALDDSGQSAIIIDGPAQNVIWSTRDYPAENDGNADAGEAEFGFPDTGVNFVWIEIPPDGGADMHATNTIN